MVVGGRALLPAKSLSFSRPRKSVFHRFIAVRSARLQPGAGPVGQVPQRAPQPGVVGQAGQITSHTREHSS